MALILLSVRMDFILVYLLRTRHSLISDLLEISLALTYLNKVKNISGKPSKKTVSRGKLLLFYLKTPLSSSVY